MRGLVCTAGEGSGWRGAPDVGKGEPRPLHRWHRLKPARLLRSDHHAWCQGGRYWSRELERKGGVSRGPRDTRALVWACVCVRGSGLQCTHSGLIYSRDPQAPQSRARPLVPPPGTAPMPRLVTSVIPESPRPRPWGCGNSKDSGSLPGTRTVRLSSPAPLQRLQ